MAGRAVVHDAELVRAAAAGDGDAFGTLFERHLTAVFEVAWQVLRNREVAAEIARDTFVDAWSAIDRLPQDDVAAWLVSRSRDRAEHRMEVNAPVRPTPTSVAAGVITGAARPTGPGPVLRALIIGGLETHGVPTRNRPASYSSGYQTSVYRGAHAAPPEQPGWQSTGSGLSRVLDSPGARIGAATLLVLLLGVAGIVLVKRSGDGVDLDALADDTAAAGGGEELRTSTTADATTTTTASTTSTTSTTSSTTTTTEPPTTTEAPTTTVAPPAPPPPPPSTEPPPAPRIRVFWGGFFGQGDGQCRDGRMLSLWWNVEGAESARFRQEGGDWQPAELPMGGANVCSRRGTRWYLEASNGPSTSTESFVA